MSSELSTELDNIFRNMIANPAINVQKTLLVKATLLLLDQCITNIDATLLCQVLEQVLAPNNSPNFSEELISAFTNACLTCYNNAIATNPASAQHHYELGTIYIELNQVNDAIACYQKAIALEPTYAAAFFKLGNAEMGIGNLQPAKQNYQQAIKLNPEFAKPYVNLAYLQAQQERYTEAATNLRQAIQIQPNFVEALTNLGGVLIKLSEFKEAEAYCRQAIELKPNHATAYLNLGSVLVEQGKLEEAITCFEAVIKINPTYANAYCNLGVIFTQQEQLNTGLAYLQKAIALRPNYADAYCNLSTVFHKQGKFAEAIAHCQKALAIQPHHMQAYCNLALAFFQQGALEEAIAHCQKALAIQPNCAEAYAHLGLIAAQQNRLDAAIAHLQRAIEIKPTYANAYWNLMVFCNRLAPIDSRFYQTWRQIAKQYHKHCQDRDPILSNVAIIWAFLNSGLASAAIEQQFLHLSNQLYDTSHFITQTEIEVLYEILQFVLPHLLDDSTLHAQLSRFIGSVYVEKILKSQVPASIIKIKQLEVVNQSQNLDYRKLRIGLISPNLTRHSVGWCSGDIIRELSYITPHIHLYLTRKILSDDRTQIFIQASEKMYYPKYDANGYANPTDIIEEIQADHIDVLLDLDSLTIPLHTHILYARPAPVCISWLGFDAPFISEQNYYLSDYHTQPKSVDINYVEQIIRMPDSFLAIGSLESEPIEREILRHTLGISPEQVVYLSIIPGRKFNSATATAQVRTLKHIPNSILIHKGGGDTAAIQAIYEEQCEIAQVDRRRLRFLGVQRPEEKHRTTYLAADVMLDSYPFNAGTLAAEALWFNLPLITHVGQQFFARMGYSFLSTLGVESGMAWNWEEYINWGIRYGKDIELRNYVKQQLIQSKQPQHLSPLWNPHKFAKDLYQILQAKRFS